MIVELRQYTLHPGQRDVLIELFESTFLEPQIAAGMQIPGTFRDLDDPDRFVWFRTFPDMPARKEALTTFYGGPIWKANRDAANATMIDSDNVLLLRAAGTGAGFAKPASPRAPVGTTTRPRSRVLATIYSFDAPVDDAFRGFFDRELSPALAAAGVVPIARLETEAAENTFPRLPVRTGEHVFVWFARFDDDAARAAAEAKLAASSRWIALKPKLETMLKGPVERLVLEPTARSDLR